jgi:hypothetical protein
VIVRNIWQKLSSLERKVTLIVTDFWQLLSRIFGETLLIVTGIWPNLVLERQHFRLLIHLTQGLLISEVGELENLLSPNSRVTPLQAFENV